ncbi:MAG: SGNH/GDSL hydrolase family protein [Clostridiaceae bacterium]|nr:SGNH/GDSL hydrolase family protein [Clostridiaceae bacterium]
MINLRKIGVWGDSVLKGVVLDDVRGTYQLLSDSCVHGVEQILGVTILNKSRFGCTIDKGCQMLERSLSTGLDCDMILLEYGGNDCDFNWPAVSADPALPHQPRTPLPVFLQTMQRMIDMLRSQNIQPLLMSLPPISGERYLDFIVERGSDRKQLLRFLGDPQQIYRFHELYSLGITRLASQNHCPYAAVREAFLTAGHCPDLLCRDGIHPNEKGHLLMQQVFTELSASAAG